MKRLALATGAVLLAACGSPTHTTGSTTTVTQTVTGQPNPTPTVEHAPPPPLGRKTIIDPYGVYQNVIDTDGTFLVGVDIAPGLYRRAVGTRCQWARLGSVDLNDIIDSDKRAGPQVVEIQIRESDTAFLTQGCGTWQQIPYF